MPSVLTPRLVFFGIAAVCAFSMAFAYYYLELHLGLAACPLCMTQRVFVVSLGVFAFIAALHNPGTVGRRIYSLLCLLSACVGGAVAARHIWLQNLPEDQVPACGPSLEYMLDTLPFSETFSIVMMGDGNCANVSWTFLGMTIPEQVLALFVVLGLACGWQLLRGTSAHVR
jgi:protein dithiol:quinone oxidoreductase